MVITHLLDQKVKVIRSLVIGIVLCACEPWTLRAALYKRMHYLEIRCSEWLLNDSYKERVTNEEKSKQPLLENKINSCPWSKKAGWTLFKFWLRKDDSTEH